MTTFRRISVIVPLHNEAGNVRPLVEAVEDALQGAAGWELILVDDGSTDATAAEARYARRRDPERVRVVELARNYGQTAALRAGIDHAGGDVIVAMDGDLQNDPADIPALVAKLDEGYDLVAGYRVGRRDPFLTRRLPSWAANGIIRWLTGVPIQDTGCSLKAYRREVTDRLRLYSDLHRYIPAVAVGTTGARIAEVPVRHRARVRGTSKYGLSRIGGVLGDLLVITTIRSFRERPLHIFSGLALLVLMGGLGFGLATGLSYFGPPSGRPTLVFPAAALLLVGLSVYLLLLGVLAEVAVRKHNRRFGSHGPLSRPERPQ